MTVGAITIERSLIAELIERERERFVAEHPKSRELHERGTGVAALRACR